MDKVKREQFIAAAIQELKPRGFNILGPLVQADVESGRFSKVVGWNNFWGIKSSRNWKGKEVERLTTEFYRDPEKLARFLNDSAGRIEKAWWDRKRKRHGFKVFADFRDWYSEPEAMKWYAGLIQRGYPKSWRHRGDADPTQFFKGFLKGTWGAYCTEDNYDGILLGRWQTRYKGGVAGL